MRNILTKLIIFSLGAAAGSGLTYLVINQKAAKVAQDEIDQMRQYFEQKYSKSASNSQNEALKGHSDASDEEEVEPIERADSSIASKYLDYSRLYAKPPLTETHNEEELSDGEEDEVEGVVVGQPLPYIKPTVITPEEFSELNDCDKLTLTYYAGDGVLADEGEEMVDDINAVIGDIDYLKRFGEFEEDVLYIHNPNFGVDYEVIRDHRSYHTVIGMDDFDD